MTGLVSFLGLCALITITPGLDTAVVVRSALRGGRSAGLRTALGCAAGLFVHATAVAIGVAQLLLRSEAAFEAVKLTGAVVLVALGARSLWSAWRGAAAGGTDAPAGAEAGAATDARVDTRRGGMPFAQGLMTNLTNPKATMFFMASLPQFIPLDRPGEAIPIALALALVAVVFSLTGLGLVAVGVHHARRLLRSRRARRVQDGLLGATLLTLGARVATE